LFWLSYCDVVVLKRFINKHNSYNQALRQIILIIRNLHYKLLLIFQFLLFNILFLLYFAFFYNDYFLFLFNYIGNFYILSLFLFDYFFLAVSSNSRVIECFLLLNLVAKSKLFVHRLKRMATCIGLIP